MKAKLTAIGAAMIIRALNVTLRVSHARSWHIEKTPQYILVFWHAHLLLMLHSKFRRPITVMSSRSKDGELIAGAFQHYSVDVIRGSSSRGGGSALRGLIRNARKGFNIVFTPDGPTGPARIAKDGVIYAAQVTGLPIVPIGFAAKKKSCCAPGTAWSCRGRSHARSICMARRSSCRVMATSRSGGSNSSAR